MSKSTKQPEYFQGSLSALPHAVQDSLAFTGATDKAKSLLLVLIRQANGKNNGHFHLAPKWIKKQGYTSSSVYASRNELITRGLIQQTKWGGLNNGANLYALTWLQITNFIALDIEKDDFLRGAWGRCKLLPTPRRAMPKNSKRESLQRLHEERSRTATTPVDVIVLSTTNIAAENSLLADLTSTTSVNNVVNTNTPSTSRRRVVGAKGKSGVVRASIATQISTEDKA